MIESWFVPEPVERMARVRGGLCVLAAAYLLSCWGDLDVWYGEAGIQSTSRVASFLAAAGLQSDARWYLSPLFLTDSIAAYRAVLAAGVLLAGLVLAGRGGRVGCLVLWGIVVSMTNRSLFLAGLAETLLSWGLFAAALAPPAACWYRSSGDVVRCWTAGLSRRLIAVQVSLLAVATTATMLAGSVWWNGLGSFALAAPVEDRTIDWTTGNLAEAWCHDLLTHAIVLSLPIGVVLAWRRPTATAGVAIVSAWCLVIALLGSHWLYAATFAVLAAAIPPCRALSSSDSGSSGRSGDGSSG